MDTSNHSRNKSKRWRLHKLVLLPRFAHQAVTLECQCLNLCCNTEHLSMLQSAAPHPVSVTFLWITELTDVRTASVIGTDLIGIPPAICFGNSCFKLNINCYQLFTCPGGNVEGKTH